MLTPTAVSSFNHRLSKNRRSCAYTQGHETSPTPFCPLPVVAGRLRSGRSAGGQTNGRSPNLRADPPARQHGRPTARTGNGRCHQRTTQPTHQRPPRAAHRAAHSSAHRPAHRAACLPLRPHRRRRLLPRPRRRPGDADRLFRLPLRKLPRLRARH
jgi:hypothetical protein